MTGDPLGGSFVLDDVTFTPLPQQQPVPEPGTLSLMALGIAGLVRNRIRRALFP